MDEALESRGNPSLSIICGRCGKTLPAFNDAGQHNFCPTSGDGGSIITVCRECKMTEITAKWKAKS
jgi:hypothetical protein